LVEGSSPSGPTTSHKFPIVITFGPRDFLG
jgi:hypothetical protein